MENGSNNAFSGTFVGFVRVRRDEGRVFRQFDNHMDGEWVAPIGGARTAVYNPATGEEIARVAASTRIDVDAAVARAVAASASFALTTPRERSDLLCALAAALGRSSEELADLEALNTGKAIVAARGEKTGARHGEASGVEAARKAL
ncbi:MAG: aldehyde dehydrogenase family protein [Acetobacteraceae bacterium]